MSRYGRVDYRVGQGCRAGSFVESSCFPSSTPFPLPIDLSLASPAARPSSTTCRRVIQVALTVAPSAVHLPLLSLRLLSILPASRGIAASRLESLDFTSQQSTKLHSRCHQLRASGKRSRRGNTYRGKEEIWKLRSRYAVRSAEEWIRETRRSEE